MRFLTARLSTTETEPCRLRVELLRRTDDFRGEPEVLAVGDAPFDPFLQGRVREACRTLGLHIEQGEERTSHTGLTIPLADPETR